MTLTDRDRKILIGLLPLALVAGIWLLVLAPKRSEASKVQDQLASAEQRRDVAEGKAGSVESAKTDYAKDYETVVRLGKAIPSSVDMPSLIVQLSKASKGAHISFDKVATGDRSSSPASGSSAPGGASSSTSSPTPAASSGSGGSSSGSTSSGSTSSAGSGSTPGGGSSSSTSSSAPSSGSTPPASAGGGSTTAPGSGSSGAPGLDTVPLTFGFDGSFFDLADFFHRMKPLRAGGEPGPAEGRRAADDHRRLLARLHRLPQDQGRGQLHGLPRPEEPGRHRGRHLERPLSHDRGVERLQPERGHERPPPTPSSSSGTPR